MLKLWGRNNSVNVQKAIWCLEELKLPYQRIDAGMQYGVVNEPQFRKMNPNSLARLSSRLNCRWIHLLLQRCGHTLTNSRN